MAKAEKKEKTPKFKKKLPSLKLPNLERNSQQRLILGALLACFGLILFVSFLSFLFTGQADQSAISEFTDKTVETKNWMSKSGAWLSSVFISNGFGISAFLLSGLMLLSSVYIFINAPRKRIQQQWFWGLLIMT